ncbi:VWA domain-containing protein [Rhodoferax sp. GW822-FHT02A01]|uniref:vWA domain-containing protein n=1 Tax=Rhodoferax sp. GW822-FHT02A01 TaxID=3141537 RepID=UPI00315D06A7
MHTLWKKTVCGLLIQVLVGTQLALAASVVWPTPAPPRPVLQQVPPITPRPNFEAPSATHCQRGIETREVSDGLPRPVPFAMGPMLRKEMAPERATESDALRAPHPAPLAATPAAAAARSESKAMDAPASPFFGAEPRMAPAQPAQQNTAPVTAGMVDDNAAFSEYLAFRKRTQVAHRERDVRDRYLLEVTDTQGRGLPDAEVAVQSANGATTWLRTDAGGKGWIHPDAFDPGHSRFYDVTVRQGGMLTTATLQRGQKSAVEVHLTQARQPAPARLDLVFLVDATGSMGDEIDKLKSSLRSITDEVSRLPSHPDLCLGLVAYRDRGDDFFVRSHDLTNDINAFQGVLNALQAGGGGDEPEAMNEALNEAVHHISWRGEQTTRLLVLVADAPPHLDYGGPQYDDDMMAALGKGIKIMSVGASGLNKQGEYIQRQMAQYTGGRFIFLTYADASNPASGPGRETVHDVRNYSVQTLDKLVVRLVREELDKLPRS